MFDASKKITNCFFKKNQSLSAKTMLHKLLLSAASLTLIALNSACAQNQTAAPATPAPTTTVNAAATPTVTTPNSAAEPTPIGDSTPSTAAKNNDWSVHSSQIRFSRVYVKGKYIAMTFDDGPSATDTPRLLDILAKRHIHVTFFVVGENAARYPKILKREVAQGCEIGNHSWSHPQLSKMSKAAVTSQILRTQNAIQKATGLRPVLLRPPYGAITKSQQKWIHNQLGYDIIMWEVDPLDWKHMHGESNAERSARVKRSILKDVRPGDIVLSHDIHSTTVDAMPSTLDALLAEGYKFVTVSQLINMATPVPPKPKKTAPKKASHTSRESR